MLALAGILAGLWAQRMDQLGAVTSFVVTPLTFLSGTFYSVADLPEAFRLAAHLNPFFYMIDGFRRGFFGVSDVSPFLSLAVVGTAFVIVASIALRLLASGYKLRH
jgi:ABC-2 type transport system permease protein